MNLLNFCILANYLMKNKIKNRVAKSFLALLRLILQRRWIRGLGAWGLLHKVYTSIANNGYCTEFHLHLFLTLSLSLQTFFVFIQSTHSLSPTTCQPFHLINSRELIIIQWLELMQVHSQLLIIHNVEFYYFVQKMVRISFEMRWRIVENGKEYEFWILIIFKFWEWT